MSSHGSGATRVLTSLALFSGCCALAYEILYMRALTTVLGDMLYVHAALLSTFLVGIGLGALLAHRFLPWLWLMECLTGAYALALPLVARRISESQLLVPVAASPTLTILATVALLCVPSILIGFSIPLFSAYIKARHADRLSFQGVYIAYNLGALLSILVVEFVLVRQFGVQRSLALVGAINLINGVILLWMKPAAEVRAVPQPREFPARVVLGLALASGVSAVFQMFFLKLTYLVFSPHRENFAIGLSVTMLGIFLGALVASKVRVSFATFMAMVPLTVGTIYLLFMPIVRLFRATIPGESGSELLILMQKFGIGCLFALGPILLFGAALPALMRSEQDVAGESGYLLWISSAANAAGYLAYVLVGHPMLTTGVLLAVVAVGAALSSLLAADFRWSRLQVALAAAGMIVVVFLVATWSERDFYLAQWADELNTEDQAIVYKSGAESATLLQSPDEEWVSYNGHTSIYVQRNGIVTVEEMISGVIPSLSAPTLGRAAVLGLGTGITAGATARIFEHTDVVEINNAFYKMMPDIHYANLDLGDNAAADLYLTDGRAFLVGKEGVYDAIVNSIPAPTYYSASKIYTLEFYRRVVRALKPDGVFCTWLAVPNMSAEGVRTILSALHLNFRYCDLRLMGSGYYSSTCSNEPLRLRGISELPLQQNLTDGLHSGLPGFDLDEYFEDIRLSDNVFKHYRPEVPYENTDDHPVLEFQVVRNFQLGKLGRDPFFHNQDLMNVDPVRADEVADRERLRRRAAMFRWHESNYYERNFVPLLEAEPPDKSVGGP